MRLALPISSRRTIFGPALFFTLLLVALAASLGAQCFADGGRLSLEEGGNILITCADDGESDAFTPIVTGAEGDNFAWVIASASGNILAVPPGPTFDLEGQGPGACFLYQIAFADGFTGVIAPGTNICNYTADDGCFDISNHITINRKTGDDCDALVCDALSSEISLTDGSTSTSICVDGTPDPLEVVMSGPFAGQNTTFIITDATTGEILGIPPGVGPFDLDGAGPGTCVIWYLAFDDGLTGLTVGQNADDLEGCFDLSNGIVVARNEPEAGTIALADGSDAATICVDGTPDPLEVILSGETSGANATFVITDVNGMILGIPGNNGPFDLDGAGPGTCLIWYLAFEDGLEGAAVGMNANDLVGCFDLSNPITVVRNEADAGSIALEDGATEATICVDDTGDPLTVVMSGDVAGDNATFFITDQATGEILGVPGNNGPFDLNGAGAGVCEIWYLSAFGDVTGVTMGGNIADIAGCFDLSNPIVVNRVKTEAGTIALADGTTEATICVDGVGDPLEVLLDGAVVGANRTFVITDDAANILAIPAGNGPFDLDPAGPGTCLIWYLAFEDGLEGAEVGMNANDLVGCFDLSNPITVVRNEADAGSIALEDGATEATICVDDTGDPLTVVMSGDVAGDNATFFITDAVTGEILGVPGDNGPFDLNGAGAGVCDIWYLSAFGDVTGVTMGGNIADLTGCFDLSNPIVVTRVKTEAGTIALADGTTEATICVDGVGDPLDVLLDGAVVGANRTFVITDDAANILAIPAGNGPFDLDGAGPGTCLIWYLAFEDGLEGAEVGMNANDLVGCFDLSNPITVVRNEADAGSIALEDGTAAATICAGDGTPDPLTVVLSGDVAGDNSTFFITDAATGEILGVPGDNGPFDLEGAGGGVCDIWYLAAYGDVTGLVMGGNIADIAGCFDLSNPIAVTRLTGDDCNDLCAADGGMITLEDGGTETSICVDGIGDPLTVIRDGNAVGTNRTFVITDANGMILGIPGNDGPFDLDGAGPGTCLIWYLAFEDGLEGAEVGMNANDLVGCFDLSNPITVVRNEADAGSIALEDGTAAATICAGDGTPDPLTVVLSGDVAGDNSTFFITDAATGEILGVPGDNGPFDLEGAGGGICDIWYLAAYGDVTGLVMGGNIADIAGCFDLSNPIAVTRLTGDDCNDLCAADGGMITLEDGGTETSICVDGIGDPLTVIRDGNAVGTNRTFVITDANGMILGIPGNDGPFDLDGAGPGTCLIWYLAFEDGLEGAEVGMNANDLVGCFDLSNPITVVRNEADAGSIALEDGTAAATICAGDGTPDPLTVVLSGDVAGDNSTFFITDAATGEILGVPGDNGPFDLEGAGGGICDIWYLAAYGDVTGLVMGGNIADIAGCFDLSNPIAVTRNVGADCGGGFNFTNVVINEVAADGMIELFNGTDIAIDISSYWLCNFPAYTQVSNLTVECGELLIQPGEVTVISGFNAFDAVDAELGLYTTNSFGSSTALVSYLEWGSSGHQRSSVAVAAGIWANGQVADAPTADQSVQLSISDSNELAYDLAAPTLCSVNNATTPTGTPGVQMSISVFPNPVQGGMLNLVLDGMSGEMMRIQIIDINGQLLYNSVTEMGNGQMGVDLPITPAGTYFLRVINNGSAVTQRFTRF